MLFYTFLDFSVICRLNVRVYVISSFVTTTNWQKITTCFVFVFVFSIKYANLYIYAGLPRSRLSLIVWKCAIQTSRTTVWSVGNYTTVLHARRTNSVTGTTNRSVVSKYNTHHQSPTHLTLHQCTNSTCFLIWLGWKWFFC